MSRGFPTGPEVPISPDATIDGAHYFGRLGDQATIAIIITKTPYLPDDPDSGTWIGVEAGRSPGSALFAAIVAAGIARSVDASVRDEMGLLGLGRDFAPEALETLLRASATKGRDLGKIEAIIGFRQTATRGD